MRLVCRQGRIAAQLRAITAQNEIRDTRHIRELRHQFGLDRPFVSGTSDFDAYFAVPHQTFATNAGTNNWQSDVAFALPLKGYLDFDLGASHRVRQLAIWTLTAREVDVSFSEDPAGLATAPVAGSFLLVNHASFPFSYAVDMVTLGTPQQGRYMRLAINSAYLIQPGFNFTYAILGEVVASVAPAAVPTLAITQGAGGDMTVTFTGTLQSAPSADGVFLDVPGSPQSPHVLPGGSLEGHQYFRSQNP